MTSDPPSDEELLIWIQGKDARSLEMLYDRHRVLAYSLALRTLGNPGDAEDVVQEAFLNIWRAAGTYRVDRSSARSWMLTIVHHRAIDKLRGRQSRIQPAAIEEGMEIPDSTDVWQEVAANLTGEGVRQALAILPPEQRETIQMAYFQGYTHSQIAEQMDVPLGTVKGRMRIGLHKLKSVLQNSKTGMALE